VQRGYRVYQTAKVGHNVVQKGAEVRYGGERVSHSANPVETCYVKNASRDYR
jgi:hypothetical protein